MRYGHRQLSSILWAPRPVASIRSTLIIVVWRCNWCWAALAPSLRGLSKIYLIFDWGSVLKTIRHPLSHKNRLRGADSCDSSPKGGAKGGCAAVRPQGAVVPEGRLICIPNSSPNCNLPQYSRWKQQAPGGAIPPGAFCIRTAPRKKPRWQPGCMRPCPDGNWACRRLCR